MTPRYETRIKAAKNYIKLHIVDDVDLWSYSEFYEGDERYLAVYNNMVLGRYGKNETLGTALVIEIPACESKSGHPVEYMYD